MNPNQNEQEQRSGQGMPPQEPPVNPPQQPEQQQPDSTAWPQPEPAATPSEPDQPQPAPATTQPAASVVQDNQVNTATVTPPQQPHVQASRKKLVLVALIILAFVIGGTGAWLMIGDDTDVKESVSSNNDSSSQAETQDGQQPNEEEQVAMTETVFTSALENTTATVSHPASWKVETSEEELEDGTVLKTTKLSSDKGSILYLYDTTGKGGACDPDDDSYTLVKRIPTATSDAVFSEYSGNNVPVGLRLENLTGKSEAHRTLMPGDSNTGICENVSGYPVYGGVFVSLATEAGGGSKSQQTSYDDISGDAAFLDVLKSLEFGS